jgi:3-oxoacyl-[acyl-carrier protein] reductase
MLRAARVMMLRGGSVINISSIAARLGAPGYGQYAASKAAVESLTRTAALELAPRDIRVNAIAPGTIETAMVPPDHPERKIIAAFCPLGRPGAPEDVAALAHFLASSESAYITGQVFVVDGGMTAGLGVRALELAIGG